MTRNTDGGDSRWKDKLSFIYFSASSGAAEPAEFSVHGLELFASKHELFLHSSQENAENKFRERGKGWTNQSAYSIKEREEVMMQFYLAEEAGAKSRGDCL